MNWPNYIVIFIVLFIASLLQVSFFPYFAILGSVPNLVLVVFFLVIFFEPQQFYMQGSFTAIVAGLFLDIFLPSQFGVSIVSLLGIYLLNKLMHYLLREGKDAYAIFYFIGTFAVSFILYEILLYIFSLFFPFEHSSLLIWVISLPYSLAFVCIGFYGTKQLFSKSFDNQLKLL